MTKTKTISKSYDTLLQKLKTEIADGIKSAKREYEREIVSVYWRVGQVISLYLKENDYTVTSGQGLYKQLSVDLSLSERMLYVISQFYNAYPTLEPHPDLNWSHYRLLSRIKDAKERGRLEARVLDERLSKRTLEKIIKSEAVAPSKDRLKYKKLRKVKGKLYTYRLFKPDYSKVVLIDCGFNIYYPSNKKTLKYEFATTEKTSTGYKLKKANATPNQLYTYKAYLKRIIDGDTIVAIVDCGFDLLIEKKIRLRGIDTDDIKTPKGKEAKKFLERKLKGLPFIVIKSIEPGKYDRYICDVYYKKDEPDPQQVLDTGTFLNDELLEKELALRLNF